MALLDPNDLFPDNEQVAKENMRKKIREIDRRLGSLPDGYALVDTGELIAIDDQGQGPAPVSASAGPLSMGGREVASYRPKTVDLGTSLTLRDSLHLASMLIKADASSCVISCEPHPDPSIGVQDNFICTIYRYNSAGVVQVVSSLQNQHDELHNCVANSGIATLFVDVARGVWCLHGKTELIV